jgi:dipeptidyl aminopeptidase/acylaminoacyl peptidase
MVTRAVSGTSARILLGCVVLLGLLYWPARIAYWHYEDVSSDFEPSAAAPILKHPEQLGIAGLQEVAFRSHDRALLAGWYVPSRNRAAVIITHGTNSDRASMVAELRILATAGFGVLAFDWPGNGASAGRIRWSAPERDALSTAIDWLSARPDVDTRRLGGLGFSMGGYVMAQVAAKDARLRAVILLAAPTDYVDLTHWQNREWGLLSELPAALALWRHGVSAADLRAIDVVGEIAPRTLLLVRGSADDTVPEFMTRALYAAARAPKSLWIIPGAKHGGYAEVAPSDYRSRLVQFFSDNLVRDAAASYHG